jgi:hypothetical protein
MRPRKIIWAYQDWMRRRKLAKLCPETAALRAQRDQARREHRAIRNIERKQRAIMNGLLEG